VSLRTAIFDLDGTLIDSKPGITSCVQHALRALGEPAPSVDDLEWTIGPPMIESLTKLVGAERAPEAQRIYRARYAETGLFDNRVYEGIPDLLARLQADGYALYVATSKLQPFARKIVDHLGFDRFFREVYGTGLDGSFLHKDALLAHVLSDARIDATEAAMIGDRRHDVIGARANGLPAIGVRWGYGEPGELEAAGAAAFAARAVEIPAVLDDLLG